MLLFEVFASADAVLRERNVDSELQHVLDHPRQQALEQLTRLFEARVGVHFDQPRVEVFVEDEVIAKEFETELAPVRIQCLSHCIESLQDNFVHLWNQVLEHAHTTLRVVLINIVLEHREAQHISIFEVAIILCMLLHCIVREVHESIVNVLEVDAEFRRGRSQVTFFEEVKLMVLIEQDPDTYVELSLVD